MPKRVGNTPTKKKRGPRPPTGVRLPENASEYRKFIHQQMEGVDKFTDLKTTSKFPSTRIKGIMRADPDVRMISADATAIMTKACEVFVIDLTRRASDRLGEAKTTLSVHDVVQTIRDTPQFDFLVDLIQSGEPPVVAK